MAVNENRFYKPASYTSVLCLVLSACGGGASGGAGDGSGNGVDRSAGVVNGFHVVRSTGFDEFDQIRSTRVLEYDLDRNRISSTLTEVDDEGNTIIFERFIYYDEDGRTTRQETPNGSTLRVTDYTIDDSGLITQVSTGVPINTVTEFEYDALGRLMRTRETQLDSIDEPDYQPIVDTYTYDADGNLTMGVEVQTYFDSISGQIVTDTLPTVFTSNSLGQIIRSETTDSTVGISITRDYSYDNNGNMIEQIWDDTSFFRRTVYAYEANEEPIANTWLRRFRFFP